MAYSYLVVYGSRLVEGFLLDYLLECLAFFDSSSFVTVDSAGSIKDSDYLLCEVSQICFACLSDRLRISTVPFFCP